MKRNGHHAVEPPVESGLHAADFLPLNEFARSVFELPGAQVVQRKAVARDQDRTGCYSSRKMLGAHNAFSLNNVPPVSSQCFTYRPGQFGNKKTVDPGNTSLQTGQG